MDSYTKGDRRLSRSGRTGSAIEGPPSSPILDPDRYQKPKPLILLALPSEVRRQGMKHRDQRCSLCP